MSLRPRSMPQFRPEPCDHLPGATGPCWECQQDQERAYDNEADRRYNEWKDQRGTPDADREDW